MAEKILNPFNGNKEEELGVFFKKTLEGPISHEEFKSIKNILEKINDGDKTVKENLKKILSEDEFNIFLEEYIYDINIDNNKPFILCFSNDPDRPIKVFKILQKILNNLNFILTKREKTDRIDVEKKKDDLDKYFF